MRLIKMLFIQMVVLAGCNFQSATINYSAKTTSIISGVVQPFVGSIAKTDRGFFISHSYAALCTNPVHAQLYELKPDGTIDENNYIISQRVESNSRYTFSPESLGIRLNPNVQYVVVTRGCNNEVYKRPVTNFDGKQDVSFHSTLVAEVVNVDNTSLGQRLNQISRERVQELIDKIDGSSRADALNSILNDSVPVTGFTNIFGVSPEIILDARPEVFVDTISGALNELQPYTYGAHAFHSDPSYSVAFNWRLDGLDVSSTSQFTYIPTGNSQGIHTLELRVGKNVGNGSIDTTKPYYQKQIAIVVNNTVFPATPALDISPFTPSPIALASIDLDIATGASLVNCEGIDKFAITESSTQPAPMAFSIACTDAPIQTESINVSGADGNKIAYLWALDAFGEISPPRSVSFVLDTTPPVVTISGLSTLYQGGATISFNYTVSDATTGVDEVKLFYSADGVSFTEIKNLSPSGTSDSFSVPGDNATAARIRIVATDFVGHARTVDSSVFGVDSLPPTTPTISLVSDLYSTSNTVTLRASVCPVDVVGILVNESTQPSASAGNWVSCSTTGFDYLIPGTTEGLHTLKVWSKDLAGNVSTATDVPVYLDLTAPILTIAPVPVAGYAGVLPQSITFTLTEINAAASQNIEVELFNGSTWEPLGQRSISNGPLSSAPFSFNFTLPILNITTGKIRASYTDLAGRNAIAETVNFKIDSLEPTISGMTINSGSGFTNNNNVQVSFSMNDSNSNISQFCIKYSQAKPSDTHSCWRSVNANPPGLTPGPNLNLVNYYYTLGADPISYTVYAWAKDAVGNISNLTASGTGTINTDKYQILYAPGNPPVVADVIATNKDNPTNPPGLATDLTAGADSPIIIKWRAEDSEGLDPNPITISYSIDGSTYLAITSGLVNGQNGSCTVNHPGTSIDDTATGCFVWGTGNPAGHFKIKVTAKDASGQSASAVSFPMNSGNIKFLAGNIDAGIDASARSAIFQNTISNISLTDQGSLAIGPEGTIYFVDPNRGLLRVSPADGVLKLWVAKDTAYSGDGGDAALAKVRQPRRIALTYDNKLLIRDCDRIRQIDLASGLISTLIGGGTSYGENITGAQAQLNCLSVGVGKSDMLVPLPNGDILFSDSNYTFNAGEVIKFRIYNAATDRITSMVLSGVGNNFSATGDVSKCNVAHLRVQFDSTNSQLTHIQADLEHKTTLPECYQNTSSRIEGANFNPVTGIAQAPHSPTAYRNAATAVESFTGMDGRSYIMSRSIARLARYSTNPTGGNSDWETVLGNGTVGSCPDGTLATACSIEMAAVFVNPSGKIYFTDRGQVRYIDESNLVRTLAGQKYSYGDGMKAASARFGNLEALTATNAGEIIVIDSLESRIRSFTPGGIISTLAGNGNNASPSTLLNPEINSIPSTSGGVLLTDIHADAVTGDIFYFCKGISICRLDRSQPTKEWKVIVGDGATPMISADGVPGLSVRGNTTFRNKLIAYDTATKKLFAHWSQDENPNQVNRMIKEYDGLDQYRQSHIAGQVGVGDNICVPGVTMSGDCYVPYGSGVTGASYDYTNDQLLVNYNGSWAIRAFKPGQVSTVPLTLSNAPRSFAYKEVAGEDWIYYCDSTSNRLRRHKFGASSSVDLPWPSNSIRCSGTRGGVRVNPVNGNILFIFTQDGLNGVAEYVVNP